MRFPSTCTRMHNFCNLFVEYLLWAQVRNSIEAPHTSSTANSALASWSIFRHGFDGADVSSFVMQRAAAARGREV